MIKVHRNAFLSKAFPSPACGKCLNFTTNTSALKLIMGFASASKSNTLRRSNFWFLSEPTYMDGGPADTGPKGRTGPQSTRFSCAGSAGTAGEEGPTMLCVLPGGGWKVDRSWHLFYEQDWASSCWESTTNSL